MLDNIYCDNCKHSYKSHQDTPKNVNCAVPIFYPEFTGCCDCPGFTSKFTREKSIDKFWEEMNA